MNSLDPIIENWKWLGSAATIVSIFLTLLRKWGGPWRLIRVIRGFFRPYKVIADLQDKIIDLQTALERAQKDAEGERQTKEWVIERNEELRAVLRETIAAAETIKEARDKGFLVTMHPSSPAPTPPSDSSTTSPTKRGGPLDLLGH